uniref:non-specific serine/threonine protein kinase n=1 Tax=Nicotiana sylvestris TaxID=4096 RepID=A0A1U7V541_NICSY|nr:PREDICTED: G-type lectin S-receptor-like serine/threonine-protein kinase At4g27290 [Nicotiana sylvestris]
MTLDECRAVCLRNCSCMGYTNLDIRNGGSGWLLWIGELVDIRQLSQSGQDIYIRVSASDTGEKDNPIPHYGEKVFLDHLVFQEINRTSIKKWIRTSTISRNNYLKFLNGNGKKAVILAVALPLLVASILLGLGVGLILYKRRREDPVITTKGRLDGHSNKNDNSNQSHSEDFELPLFDLFTLTKATDNFSFENKIGEGGFGQVYKGVLEDGQEVAVTRLSETSEQGLHEFKNEVNCIAKLQHRNLVKLLGCCIRGVEKMFLYEYLPNKSLDLYIFGLERSAILDWPKRFNIIKGIARGLMYLHQDSRLRIIQRLES